MIGALIPCAVCFASLMERPSCAMSSLALRWFGAAWELGVQELGRHRSISLRGAKLQRLPFHGAALERADPGPAVQLIARDAFVSETAIKLDQLAIEIKSVGRDIQLLKSDLAEIKDEAAQNFRFSQIIDREHKSRAAKLDELSKRFDYLKARFDAIDGHSKGDYHAFRSFEDVSRRLTELGALERDFRQTKKKLALSVGLFAASVFGWFLVLVAF
jgi:hypothetical protein